MRPWNAIGNGARADMSLSDATLERFKSLFNAARPDLETLMAECYSETVVFRDPLVERRGREALSRYLNDAYARVTRCGFDFGSTARCPDHLTLPWTMTLEHRRLARGAPIIVDGITLLQTDAETGLISYHRDYYDAGQLIYENVPLIGGLVRYMRRQAS